MRTPPNAIPRCFRRKKRLLTASCSLRRSSKASTLAGKGAVEARYPEGGGPRRRPTLRTSPYKTASLSRGTHTHTRPKARAAEARPSHVTKTERSGSQLGASGDVDHVTRRNETETERKRPPPSLLRQGEKKKSKTTKETGFLLACTTEQGRKQTSEKKANRAGHGGSW